jgi:hypothetical protein
MTFGVFVPSVMGAGILVSVAILVGDSFRRVLPKTRALRQHHLIDRDAVALVTPIARSLGLEPPHTPVLRQVRSRRTYLIVAFVAAATSLYVGIGSTFNFLRPGGYLEGHVWVQVLALTASVGFFAVAVAALVLAVQGTALRPSTRWLVEHTPLGAIRDDT